VKREQWCRSRVCLRDKVAASASLSRDEVASHVRQNRTCDVRLEVPLRDRWRSDRSVVLYDSDEESELGNAQTQRQVLVNRVAIALQVSTPQFQRTTHTHTHAHTPYQTTDAAQLPRQPAKKASPYSITEHRVPKLIPVLGSQPAVDVSHKPGGRLPLLSAKPAVTPATLKRAATSFAAW